MFSRVVSLCNKKYLKVDHFPFCEEKLFWSLSNNMKLKRNVEKVLDLIHSLLTLWLASCWLYWKVIAWSLKFKPCSGLRGLVSCCLTHFCLSGSVCVAVHSKCQCPLVNPRRVLPGLLWDKQYAKVIHLPAVTVALTAGELFIFCPLLQARRGWHVNRATSFAHNISLFLNTLCLCLSLSLSLPLSRSLSHSVLVCLCACVCVCTLTELNSDFIISLFMREV